jgi:type I restriction enzyme S subunit
MSEWTEKNFHEVIDIRVSNVDKKIYPNKSLVKLCNYMDAYTNDYISSNISFSIGSADLNEIQKFGLKIDDVIITKDSETPEDIAVSTVVIEDLNKVVCGYHLAILRSNKDELDGKYLMLKLKSDELKRYFLSVAKGSTRFGLTIGDIENAKIKFPPLPEQRRIAQILTTTDAVIEETQAAIAKYKAIKQGMLHDLFTRGIDPATNKLRPSYHEAPQLYKESKLGWIPKEWDCDEFQNVCSFITDGSHFSPTPIDDGEIIVNVKDLGEFEINYESCTRISKQEFEFLKKQNCSPKKGDVLLSKDGTIGKVILFNDDLEIVILSSIAIIRSSELIKSNYFYCFLKSEYFDYQLLVKISGSALKRIVLRDINSLLICFSKDLVEQEMISKRILSIELKLQSEQTYLQKLQQIKKGLMEDLLSGKKRVMVEDELQDKQ